MQNLSSTAQRNLASPKQVEFIEKLADRLPATQETQRLRDAADEAHALTSREASKLIDKLKAAVPAQTATAKQLAFIDTLIDERIAEADREVFKASARKMSPAKASEAIDTLKAMPKLAPVTKMDASAEAVTDGVYVKDGVVYKVKVAIHGSGNLYAQQFDPETKTYSVARGMVRKLRPEHRMTEEQAQEFGKLYGVCCRCHTPLTDEESIARGMGPDCYSKQFG